MGILSNFRFSFNNIFFTPVLYGVVASLAVFLTAWDKGDRIKDKFQDKFRSKEDTFDFIIIGSGSAGAVLAYRLSEYHHVLLLEAGGEPHPFNAIPGFSLFLPNNDHIDWRHRTLRQKRSCFACVKGQSAWSQGLSLGGTSNLNFLVHLRGHPKDYDHWAQITGDPSWSYQGVLPFFKISEDFIGGSTDENAHGKGGPLTIELPDPQGLTQEFLWAAQDFGYKNVDLNGDYKEGFDAVYHPIRRGVRQATYRSFIQPARKRKTLTIRKFAHVNKILLRGNDNGAYGVEYDRHSKRLVAYATKEVIVSAGAVNSPKLLMLSGIGPWQHLNDIGITPKVDLPVGQNLQDHLSTIVGPFFIDKPRSFLLDRDINAKTFLQWGTHGTGLLTSSGITATGIFASTIAQDSGHAYHPDIQLSLLNMGVHKTFASDLANAFGIKEDVLQKFYWHATGKESFQIIASNARPVARGEIRLSSRDPYDPQIIDPNYLNDPWDADIKVMIEAFKTAIALVENSTSFQNLGGRLSDVPFPGCEHHWFRSDDYFACVIRQYSVSLRDITSTCAMGKVLDSQLRVKGTKSLRVIDASSFPQITVGGTQATTIMIAEKGSQLILEYWKSQGIIDNLKHEHYSGFANSQRGKVEPTPDDPFGNPFGIPSGDMPTLNSFYLGLSLSPIKNPFEGLLTAFTQNYNAEPTKNPIEEFFSGLFNKNAAHQETVVEDEEIKHQHHAENSGQYGDNLNANTDDGKNGYEQETQNQEPIKYSPPPVVNHSLASENSHLREISKPYGSQPSSVTVEKANLVDMIEYINDQTHHQYSQGRTKEIILPGSQKRIKVNVASRLNNIITKREPLHQEREVQVRTQKQQTPIISSDSGVTQNNRLKKPRRKQNKSEKGRKLPANSSRARNNIADIIQSSSSPIISNQFSLPEEAEVLNFHSQKLHVVNPGPVKLHTESGYFRPYEVIPNTNSRITSTRKPSINRNTKRYRPSQPQVPIPVPQVKSPEAEYLYSTNSNPFGDNYYGQESSPQIQIQKVPIMRHYSYHVRS